jgi:CorA-like Mg2+ transporter protein
MLTISAVILVDPPLGKEVRRGPANELRRVIINEDHGEIPPWMEYPSLIARSHLPDNIQSWSTPDLSPSMLSTFDEILSVYSHGLHFVDDNPSSCSVVFRQIMLSMWIGFLDRIGTVLSNTHSQIMKLESDQQRTRGYEWKDWLFADLADLKVDVEFMFWFLSCNMKALGIKMNGVGGHGVVAEWEEEEWKFVETRLHSFRQRVNSTAEIYTQAISVEEARSANAQARSVARLTALATIFVPISIIAAIFSMGGAYGVGQSEFWVFFVVTVPVLIILSALLFTRIAANTVRYVNGGIAFLRNALKKASPRRRSAGIARQGKEAVLPMFNKKSS